MNELMIEVDRIAADRNMEVIRFLSGSVYVKRKSCGYMKAEGKPPSRTRAKKLQFSRPCFMCIACHVRWACCG